MIILTHIYALHGRQRIPEKYVKKNYADQFAKDYVKLRVDGDRLWRVELLEESGKVWLTKGWEVFMKT